MTAAVLKENSSNVEKFNTIEIFLHFNL